MLLTSPAPFGLDISELSIKIVGFKKKNLSAKKEDFALSVFGEINVPENCFNKGEVKDMEKVSSLIKKLIKNPAQGKINAPYVISVLPETKSFIKLIEIDSFDDDDISRTVKDKIEKDIPLSLDEAYLDWQIIPQNSPSEQKCNNDSKLKILTAVAPKNIVDSYTLLLKKAGLKPLALEIESVAIVRSLINFKEIKNEQALAIIDLGAVRSSIIIFDQGAIQFTSSIPISGREISCKIASKLKTSDSKAEKIKIVCGLNNKKCKKTIDKILMPTIDDLIKEISEAISFYQNQANKKIDKILLCGGNANLKGLESILKQKLKIETQKGNPWTNSNLKILPAPLSNSLSYTTAIGLALRGILSKD